MELRRRLDDTYFSRALQVLDSFLMRRAAVNRYYRGFDNKARKAVRRIVALPKTSAEDGVVSTLVDTVDAWTGAAKWPEDEEIETYVPMNAPPGTDRIKLVLAGIAQHIEPPMVAIPFRQCMGEGLTIEHIMPWRWREHWESIAPGTGEDALRRFGNLTLVSQRMNTSLNNASWEKKRPKLARDNLEMNREIVREVLATDTWDVQAIEQRGKRLAKRIIEIWPHAATLRRRFGLQQAPAAGSEELGE